MAGTNINSAVTSTLWIRETQPVPAGTQGQGLAISAACTGTPPTTAGTFAHGCIMLQTDTATGTKAVYENTGSSAVPSWNLLGESVPGDINLANTHILVGNASGVAADVAMSQDATMANTGAITVASANAAFNIGTNQTWTKEVDHTSTVSASTTANTAGGALAIAAGLATGTAAGGAASLKSGASANGTGVNPGASGAVTVASGVAGTATTGTAGAAGAVTVGGTAGGASTGASSTGGAGSDVNITAGAGGNSSGGSDTGGRGGNVISAPGSGGTGATAGVAGKIFMRDNVMFKMSAPAAKTTNATLTAAELLGGLITVNQGGAGTSTLTLPLGTDLQAALPATLAVGDCFQFSVVNISTNAAEDCIMAGNTGTTYVGKTQINSNDAVGTPSAATFVVRTTGVGAGAGTFSIYRVSS